MFSAPTLAAFGLAPAGNGVFRPLRSILRRGRSASFLLVGDSTGDSDEEWPKRTLVRIAAAHRELNVVSQVWDMATQSYLAPSVIQTASGGAEYLEFFAPPPATTTPPSLPATASLDGDFFADIHIRAADYTPAAVQILFRRGDAAANTFWLGLNPTGTVRFTFNTVAGAGGDDYTATSTVPVPDVVDGVTDVYLGIAYKRDNGAGGSDYTFYTSSDGLVWTQLGAVVTRVANNLIRSDSASSWWLGGTGASFPFVGRVYGLRIRSGTVNPAAGGVLQIPQEVAAWVIGNRTYQSLAGGRTLWLYNASLPGQTLDYCFAGAFPARLPSICIHSRIPFILFSSAHNYGATVGAAYRALLSTARDTFAGAIPNAIFAGSTQNPQIDPRPLNDQLNQEQRARDFAQWCRENGYGCIHGFETFVGSRRPLPDLIGVDGVHPVALGSDLWSLGAFAEWLNS